MLQYCPLYIFRKWCSAEEPASVSEDGMKKLTNATVGIYTVPRA